MPATRALARSGLSAEGHGVAAPYAIAGTILLAIELILAMPGNGLVDLRRHRIPGTVLSHAAVTLIAIALAPMLPRALARLAALRPATALAWLAVSLTAPIGVIALVTAVAPRYARELFTREWGLVEPAQFVLYLLAARVFWLVRPPAPWTARAMRAGAIVALGLALEEIDYLGLLRHVMPLVEGHRVGGLHDVLNALAGPALLAVLGIAALLALTIATAVVARARPHTVGNALRSPITASLAAAAGFMGLAQAVDISDTHVAPLALGGPVGVVEEPAELLAIVCLDWALALWAARHVAPPR